MKVPIESFPVAARRDLANVQLRSNLRAATDTILDKRARVVAELPDWEELREAGRAIKTDVLARLDEYLLEFERNLEAAGGRVHWARDAAEANAIVASVAHAHGVTDVVKMKSLTTDEIELNAALAVHGIHALETDFAELILQLDGDWSSHILVPAIHRNRTEIRDLFARTIAPGIVSSEPRDLAEAARVYLRGRFLGAKMSRISCLFRWMAGTRMCDDQSPSSCRISSAKSVSSAWMPAAASAPLSSISSVVRDFIFTTSPASCARATLTTIAFASAASRAQ